MDSEISAVGVHTMCTVCNLLRSHAPSGSPLDGDDVGGDRQRGFCIIRFCPFVVQFLDEPGSDEGKQSSSRVA